MSSQGSRFEEKISKRQGRVPTKGEVIYYNRELVKLTRTVERRTGRDNKKNERR